MLGVLGKYYYSLDQWRDGRDGIGEREERSDGTQRHADSGPCTASIIVPSI